MDNDEKSHFNLDDLLIDKAKTKKGKGKYKPGDKDEKDNFTVNINNETPSCSFKYCMLFDSFFS